MTLAEARRLVGYGVTYDPGHGRKEIGWVVRVGESLVFVQYQDGGPKATRPGDLIPLNGPEWVPDA